jgi:hypothetical protein
MVDLVTSAGGVALALRSLLAPGILAARWIKHAPAPSGIPRPRRSLALMGKMLLDEVFFATEVISAGIVSTADAGRLLAEVEGALRLYQELGWLDDPARFHFEPPPPAAWAYQPPRRAWIPGLRDVTFDHLTFDSGYEPHADDPGRERWLGYEPVRTAHAWLLKHTGAPRPWLICVHAYRMGFPLADLLVFPVDWFHHELGLNLAFPVLPLHGPRKVGWRSGDGVFSGEILDTLHMQAQAVWDIRRLAALLRAQGAPAVGVYGLSLGGYTTALLAGVEANLDCVVAGIPHADYVDLARWNAPALMLRLADRQSVDWEAVGRLLRVISPLAIPPRVARERRYLFAATADRLVPPEHARDLWLHWECPRTLWYEGSHVSFGWEASVRTLLHEALETTGFLTAGAAPSPSTGTTVA